MTIIHGDCLEVMKTFPDNHFSAIVTDPPYGLHFMGKDWDHEVPRVDYWRECYRVLKPGGNFLGFGGTRTYHRMVCAVEDAGFTIRDQIQWIYGSGFPKSHNHFGMEGYGTALKPAHEPIVLAMKPLEGTFKQIAEKWGQAGINVDGCRVGKDLMKVTKSDGKYKSKNNSKALSNTGRIDCGIKEGRWPANIILDEEAGAMLDEQSGMTGSSNAPRTTGKSLHCYGQFNPIERNYSQLNDSGGASRFFYCAKPSRKERNEGLDHLQDKIGGEMNATVHGDTRTGRITIQKNNHPTVKPLKLMEYLIKLVMPPKNGLLLDPFAGSGTTILAAKNLGFDAIGIEKQAEYCEIARARLQEISHENLG